MATKVHMEALSPTMEEGEVVSWLKSEGDEVTNGEVLAEIETDKATMELVARGEGILRKILLGEGGTAEVGKVIAIIASEDEEIDALIADAGGDGGAAVEEEAPAGEEEEEEVEAEDAEAEEAGEAEAEKRAETKEKKEEKEVAPTKEEAAPSRKGGRIKASPLARRLAEEGDLDLARVDGSGPGGRIVKRDVEAALEEREKA
ncbi:MAG: biotin/lipoyl-containing protein, partial [Gemmatimonadota bacterium]